MSDLLRGLVDHIQKYLDGEITERDLEVYVVRRR